MRKTVFEGDTVRIGFFQARPVSDACGEVERQSSNAVVLPISGVFSKHDAPGRHVIGTPSHAVFFAADTPYRISFPGAIGDRALVLRFDDDLADEFNLHGNNGMLAPHGLLPSHAMVLRNLVWKRLLGAEADEFESEALGLELISMSLASMRLNTVPPRHSVLARQRGVEHVKEAVALAPAERWTVARLAKVANLSPFHLCHVFRQIVGASVYDYVVHERLACALGAVLDGEDDLTAIAFDAGFASHSHFTARFRRFFGCTPTAMRRVGGAERTAEFRKIMTAGRQRLA